MAKVRFIGPEPHTVPELGDRLVQPDEIVTVPDERFDAYLLTPQLWESVEEPKATETTAPKKSTAKTAATSMPAAAAPGTDTTTPAGADS